MLKIRLTRRGKKNKAFFRLVVAEHSSPIKGRFVESLGFLNPHTKEKKFEEERIKYWIGKGAQCSDSVHNMLVSAGIAKGSKRAIKMKKKEETAEQTPVPVETATAKDGTEVKPDEKKETKPEEKKDVKTEDAPPEKQKSEKEEKKPEKEIKEEKEAPKEEKAKE